MSEWTKPVNRAVENSRRAKRLDAIHVHVGVSGILLVYAFLIWLMAQPSSFGYVPEEHIARLVLFLSGLFLGMAAMIIADAVRTWRRF